MRLFLGSHLFFEGRGKEWGLSLSSASTVAYRAVLHCVGWPLSPALKEVRKGRVATACVAWMSVIVRAGEEGGKREMWSKSSLLSSWATDPSPSSFLVLFLVSIAANGGGFGGGSLVYYKVRHLQ